jgi:glycosyltransferase involved in cell wall biosynthesis
VHCEFFPYLPGFIEAAAVRIGGRPIVFDFDDAIFHMYDASPNPAVRALFSGKLEPLIRSARACTCGNDYLRGYAARFCANSVIVPTVVDTDVYQPPAATLQHDQLVVGWIGSPSTWSYVRPLLPLLAELCAEKGVTFRAIGAGKAAESDRFPGMELVDWSEESEIAELQRFSIGIMPAPHDPWARGKSGYKLIQYMACGLPVIATPVGVNCEIVRGRENGYLATTEAEWRDALDQLIGDAASRSGMGAHGRERAVREYSLAVYAPRVVEILKSAASGPARHRPAAGR